ncbi:MAG: hypothetical protein A2297_01890 [Elusimicrobia bacterium RIFOXYB2_FULL_48_7]|nr:MAG: hypothetical protein A2297_01890 [Elusimicrobia bacterium RIFOXYB2_FULL_48_7]
MRTVIPVTVPKASFNFCRITLAVIFWIGFIFRLKWLILLAFVILALSAVLGIQRAPLIMLYNITIGKLMHLKEEMLDKRGMRFAHSFGALLTLVCLLLLYFFNERLGWIFVFFVSLAKTAGALGFCSALKLYGCLTNDSCCTFLKKEQTKNVS